MIEKDYIARLLRSKNTVFTFQEITLIWGETNVVRAKQRINRYVKTGKLYAVRRGIYAKDETYNKLELATRIYAPAYISFETVLAAEGVVFQFYGQIFAASYLARELVINGQTYAFKKIKNAILLNPAGIANDGYSIATAERAFLDTIYLNKDYHFDNLRPLNWDKVFEMLPIYENKRMAEKVNQFYKHFKSAK